MKESWSERQGESINIAYVHEPQCTSMKMKNGNLWPPQCLSDRLRGICLSGSHMLAGQKVRPFADLSLVEPWKHFVVQ